MTFLSRHRIPVKIDLAMDDIDASSEIEASGSLFVSVSRELMDC